MDWISMQQQGFTMLKNMNPSYKYKREYTVQVYKCRYRMYIYAQDLQMFINNASVFYTDICGFRPRNFKPC